MILNALLGPTNTGKTHRAVERMLDHPTGMIGLPLRLLAREIYDRVSARVGESQVALVTGEEKRVPRSPRYWVCTVEAMPIDREVDFVAVDEIQLASHRQRGHVFTDRMLRARGRCETWFLGSDTVEPLVRELLPTAEVQGHPRFSTLSSAGSLSLSALPPRTAVIAFSAAQVYELADRLRRRRGGAAVVLGALSPRTRNAQVALYQSGEVQYLVATDAIGMGLNLDIDLVAFSAVHKYDGRVARGLEPAELAQIAGRAGRHQRNGCFATLAPLPPFSDEVQHALETHRFPPLRQLYWRNSDLDCSSIEALLASLRERPRRACFRLVDQAEDYAALVDLSTRPEVRSIARSREKVALLWEVCQIPDFRQLMPEVHATLLLEIFQQLASDSQSLDPEWLERRVARLDDCEGDIDTLLGRIAFIRTWTYVANHGAWVAQERRWQDRTRAIEDRLSDALHERLVQRFVAQRGRSTCRTRLRTTLREPEPQPGGREAFHSPFQVLRDLRVASSSSKSAPRPRDQWVEELVEAPQERFTADAEGRIWDGEERLAKMTRGVDLLHPEVLLQLEEDPGAGARMRITRRLVAWTRDLVEQLLSALRWPQAGELSAPARGLVHQLEQGLGTALVSSTREQLRLLTPKDHLLLKARQVRVGNRVVYVRDLLSAQNIKLRAALCSAYLGKAVRLPGPQQIAFCVKAEDCDWAQALGYPVFGPLALRADLVERIDGALAQAASQGAFEIPERVLSWIGIEEFDRDRLVEALGYRKRNDGSYERSRSGRKRRPLRLARTAVR